MRTALDDMYERDLDRAYYAEIEDELQERREVLQAKIASHEFILEQLQEEESKVSGRFPRTINLYETQLKEYKAELATL